MKHSVLFLLSLWLSFQAECFWNPVVYEKNNNLQMSDVDLLIDLLPNHKSRNILALGTREGYALSALKKRFPSAKLSSISLDPVLAHLAKQKTQHITGIHFLGASTDILERTKGFDLIFSYHYLHWVAKDKQVAVLKQIYQSLNKDGVFAAALTPMKNPERPFQQSIDQLSVRPHYQNIANMKDNRSLYTPYEYKLLLEQAGFTVMNIGYINRKRYFASIEKLKLSIQQWYSWGNESVINRNPELADAYFTDLAAMLAQKLIGGARQPGIEWDVDLMVFLARK